MRPINVVMVLGAVLATGCADAEPPDAAALSEESPAPEPSDVTREVCAMAVNARGLYWADSGDAYGTGAITLLPRAESVPVAIADEQHFPCALALDTEGVTWATYWPVGGGNIYRHVHGQGTFVLPADVDVVRGMVTVNDRVYFADAAAGTVKSVGIDGAPENTIAEGQTGVGAIAASGDALFWGTSTALFSLDFAAGSQPHIVWEGAAIAAIASDGKSVAWITTSGAVLALSGSEGELLVPADADAEEGPRGIARDADAVYFTNPAAGSVEVFYQGEVSTFAATQGKPTAIAIDMTHVYWLDAQSGAVKTATKRTTLR